jgi:hypothetical protein
MIILFSVMYLVEKGERAGAGAGPTNLALKLEWLYLLRSAKLCALWTAQAFFCANCLAPVLRRRVILNFFFLRLAYVHVRPM